MSRVNIDPGEVGARAFYKVLGAVVVPRPIAWVSTRSPEGIDNLAPHSFFTVACLDPPVVQFTSVGRKDSLNNVEATGEFVVNLAPRWLFEEINSTGTPFPPGESEFDAVGVEREASHRVTPVTVARSPVALECDLHSTFAIGESTVVFGRVINAAVDPSVMQDGRPLIDRLDPMARLGGEQWSELGAVREIARIPYESWGARGR
jgi:flavin reductase (DIM6/NTAB) family NADH-FMN oxidoreductase RutF